MAPRLARSAAAAARLDHDPKPAGLALLAIELERWGSFAHFVDQLGCIVPAGARADMCVIVTNGIEGDQPGAARAVQRVDQPAITGLGLVGAVRPTRQ